MTKQQLEEVFRAAFPLRGSKETGSLEFVEITERDKRGEFGVVVRLVVWDVGPDGTQSIRDIKEQDVYLNMPIECTLDRLEIYLAALERVLAEVLETPHLDTLMPHDILDFSGLKLARASSIEDFEKALRGKSRLGKYLLPSKS